VTGGTAAENFFPMSRIAFGKGAHRDEGKYGRCRNMSEYGNHAPDNTTPSPSDNEEGVF